MKKIAFASLFAVFIAVPDCEAQVFKCTVDGKAVYRQEPCPNDKSKAVNLKYQKVSEADHKAAVSANQQRATDARRMEFKREINNAPAVIILVPVRR
jgi:hypothetical protein